MMLSRRSFCALPVASMDCHLTPMVSRISPPTFSIIGPQAAWIFFFRISTCTSRMAWQNASFQQSMAVSTGQHSSVWHGVVWGLVSQLSVEHLFSIVLVLFCFVFSFTTVYHNEIPHTTFSHAPITSPPIPSTSFLAHEPLEINRLVGLSAVQ